MWHNKRICSPFLRATMACRKEASVRTRQGVYWLPRIRDAHAKNNRSFCLNGMQW